MVFTMDCYKCGLPVGCTCLSCLTLSPNCFSCGAKDAKLDTHPSSNPTISCIECDREEKDCICERRAVVVPLAAGQP